MLVGSREAILSLVIFIVFIFFAEYVITFRIASAAQCPAGTVPIANETDLALAKKTNSAATIGTCWKPSDEVTGAAVGEAKQYLRGILCRATANNYGGVGPDATVSGLDSKLAVCAARFLKVASSQLSAQVSLLNGGTNPVCLREGKRSVAKQEEYAEEYRRGGGIACTKGANCEHPRGVAIDVNTDSEANYWKLHAMARGFGLDFYLGFQDKVHFIARSADCSSGGTTPTDFPYSRPTLPLDQTIRRLLNTPPPPPPPVQSAAPAATQPSLGGTIAPPLGVVNTVPQPIGTCAPQFYCIGNINYYRRSSCVDQVYETCQYGCSGTACNASTTSSVQNSNTNTNTNTGTSTYDLIGQYVDIGTTSTATVTPITLNPNTSNPTVLQPPPQSGTALPSGISVLPPPAQETFVSNDLAYSPPYVGTATRFDAGILDKLKKTLIGLLNYLRPFGGNVPSQQYVD